MAHTPPPWDYVVIENKYHAGSHTEGNKTLVTVATVYSGGQAIARCHSVENARFIVKAVNCHDELVAALNALLNDPITAGSTAHYHAVCAAKKRVDPIEKARAILAKVNS